MVRQPLRIRSQARSKPKTATAVRHAQLRHAVDEYAFEGAGNPYAALSLKDLLDARDQYHVHLMRHPNVVATAIGYYRIRKEDSRPGAASVVKGTGRRTLTNSEVRSNSWPAVLVLVEHWVDEKEFAKGKTIDLDAIVPSTLYLPDGRRVPVCVIEAPRDIVSPAEPPAVRYPLNNIGGGNPVLVEVQRQEHVATVGCLATDGHRIYALTNRHVTGEAGQVIKSQLGGRPLRVGISSDRQVTRVLFSEVYPGWPGGDIYVNMDIGLIDVDDVSMWTAKVQGLEIGPMVDLSAIDFPLSLIGRPVRGYGAASQWMLGELHGLFYRYKTRGGSEYVSDFFIGPRSKPDAHGRAIEFATRPGDSGTLWLLEPTDQNKTMDVAMGAGSYRPLALQWGANRLFSAAGGVAQSYALATCLSTVCDRLDVDLIRNWNLDQPDTWGAVGHFAIASRVAGKLSRKVPKLTKLMTNNAPIISHDDDTILNSDFKGMSDDAFVPMADVPDFFWKHGKQGASRHFEGPNHFADMDQKRPSDSVDLLALCEDPRNIDPDVWNNFYGTVEDLLDGGPITPEHRGLLPFRVWQIFDAMVKYAKAGKAPEFVCAAGVLTHYVGDSCQPLHISYLHDGDPNQATSRTVNHVRGKKAGTSEKVREALGVGMHSAYEDTMVNANRKKILEGLDDTPKVDPKEYVSNGFEAAVKTVDLMRSTFKLLPPPDILQAFLEHGKSKKGMAEDMWKAFGARTISAMQNGTHLLAVLWESAWVAGGGEENVDSTDALEEDQAMKICAPRDFLPSCSVDQIGALLERPKP